MRGLLADMLDLVEVLHADAKQHAEWLEEIAALWGTLQSESTEKARKAAFLRLYTRTRTIAQEFRTLQQIILRRRGKPDEPRPAV